MLTQLTTNKHSLSIRTPRTGQIYFGNFRISGQLAIIKDIAKLFTLICRRGRHVTITFTMDMTTIEDSDRPSENKVNRSFNIAIFIVLAALLTIRIKCILITQKAAILKECTVSRYKTSYRLPYRPCRIFKSDVLCIEIRSIDVAA